MNFTSLRTALAVLLLACATYAASGPVAWLVRKVRREPAEPVA